MPYDGNIFGNGGRGKGGRGKTPKPPRPTPAAEVTPTVGVNFRTDSQFSVEQSVATQVYDKASYPGRSPLYFLTLFMYEWGFQSSNPNPQSKG